MMRTMKVLLPLFCLFLCATCALAQEDDIGLYMNTWKLFPQVIQTIMWSVAYLAIYSAAIIIPLAYLRLFTGFETETYLWIVLMWVGGMVINYFAYRLAGSHNLLAAAIAMPVIFGWALLLNTRSFADLTLNNAWRVALVIALVCAPYFGPTWHIQRPKPLPRLTLVVETPSQLLSFATTILERQ